MRIGAWLAADVSTTLLSSAENAGSFGIFVDAGHGVLRAAEVAVTTVDPRVIVRVVLGTEHPVTLAEEIAVLDQLSAGRVVCVVDTGALKADDALEDLTVLRLSWSARVFRHEGRRWTVPSGVVGDDLPREISVTPKPAQIDIPVWLDGAAASALGGRTALPLLAHELTAVDRAAQVQPAVVALTGDLDHDRDLVIAWARAGATHLLVRPPGDATDEFFPGTVARYLQPEVAMPLFPRIMAEADVPRPWMPPS